MEYRLAEGVPRPKTRPSLSALRVSLATEAKKGSTKGSMHWGSPPVLPTAAVPGATPFPSKSRESFYSQPSEIDLEAGPFQEPSSSSPNSFPSTLSVPHLPPPIAASTHQTSYSSSTLSIPGQIMTDPSTSPKASTVLHLRSQLGENKDKKENGTDKKEKSKKTKLGKMCIRASRSTKAISRLFHHSPSSGGVGKPSSIRAPLPIVIPLNENHVVDPFASGNSASSFGLSPVEPSSPTSHQRAQSLPEAKSSVNAAKPQLPKSPSVSYPLVITDLPSPMISNRLLEAQNMRSRDILFPLQAGNSSNTSLSPPVERTRSNSVSATRISKPFCANGSPPMPQTSPTATAICTSASDDIFPQLLPSPLPVSLPKSVTRRRANSVSQTKLQSVGHATKAVPLKDDTMSRFNGGTRPLPAVPARADDAPALQAQARASDVNSTVDMKRGRHTLTTTSSPSMPSLKGGYISSSLDVSMGKHGPQRRTGCSTTGVGSIHDPPYYPESECLSRTYVPTPGSTPPIASGVSERVSQRTESVSKSPEELSLSPSFHQHQPSTRPALTLLLTQNISPPADSNDGKLVNGDLPSRQYRFPRSPSLPELRPSFPDTPPVLKLTPNSQSDDLRRPPQDVHVRSPSLPSFSRDPGDTSRPQALPTWIVDRLKLRSQDSSHPRSRLLSMDSVVPNKPKHPSLSDIQPSALTRQSPPSPTTSPPQTRRDLRSPSMPDLRARIPANSFASKHGGNEATSRPVPHRSRHTPNLSHSQSIPVPPIPPLPENYKFPAPTNAKFEAAPPSTANFLRLRPNFTRLKEFSYPQTKKVAKSFDACSNKELEKEDNMDFMDPPPRPPRTPSSVTTPSSTASDCRRTSYRFKPPSMKGPGDGMPPVPPLPPPTPIPVLPALRIRNVASFDRIAVGTAF